MRPKVFAYFDTAEGADLDRQADQVRPWMDSWSKFGWAPRLLTHHHARAHKLFKDPKTVPDDFPWLALDVAGGVWMTYLPVRNLGLRPRDASPDLLRLPLLWIDDGKLVRCSRFANVYDSWATVTSGGLLS